MAKVLVLGAGRVGRAIIYDLQLQHEVTAADINEEALFELSSHFKINTELADLQQKDVIHKLVQDFDLVIGAVPGFMGFETTKTVIEAGKNIVDISFFDEDPFELDALAKSKGVTAITDCGVAPGMDNIWLAYHDRKMEVEEFICMVGGLPLNPKPPYFYKAPFSPIDVLEEYTRPARLVENGIVVIKEALTEIEPVQFEFGVLEAFNTDGLRSLIKTFPHIHNMKEKTLRFPPHAHQMKLLKDTGFLNKEKVLVNGIQVSPLDLTAQLIIPLWQLEKNEEEFTVMRVEILGKESGRKVKVTYDLLHFYDKKRDLSSMATTTGFTCTAAANLVLSGQFSKKGIFPPEFLGKEDTDYHFIMKYLNERDIQIAVKKEFL